MELEFRFPTQDIAGPSGITYQVHGLGGPHQTGISPDFSQLTPMLENAVSTMCWNGAEFAGGKSEIIRFFRASRPSTFIERTPERIPNPERAKVQFILKSKLDGCDRPTNFPCHKVLSSTWRLMIIHDAVARE